MKSNLIKKMCAGVLVMAVTAPLQATPVNFVDHATYLSDTISGLDWLDVTASTNMTVDQVSAQFDTGGIFAGYRYATALEFGALVNNYIGIDSGITAIGHHTTLTNALQPLMDMLGITHTLVGSINPTTTGLINEITRGILADPCSHPTTGAALHCGGTFDHHLIYQRTSPTEYAINHGYGAYTHTIMYAGQADETVGSFLVHRSSQVPEPVSLLLITIGLIGVVFSRRKVPTN